MTPRGEGARMEAFRLYEADRRNVAAIQRAYPGMSKAEVLRRALDHLAAHSRGDAKGRRG